MNKNITNIENINLKNNDTNQTLTIENNKIKEFLNKYLIKEFSKIENKLLTEKDLLKYL